MKTSTKFAQMAVFAGLFVCLNASAQNTHASDVAKSRAHGAQGCAQSAQSCNMPSNHPSMKPEAMDDAQKPSQGKAKKAHKQADKTKAGKTKGKHKKATKNAKGSKHMNPHAGNLEKDTK